MSVAWSHSTCTSKDVEQNGFLADLFRMPSCAFDRELQTLRVFLGCFFVVSVTSDPSSGWFVRRTGYHIGKKKDSPRPTSRILGIPSKSW